MRFSLASVLALAGAALAVDPTAGFNVLSKPAKDEKVPAGSTYEIVWAPTAQYPGPVTIGLLGGPTPGTLDIIDTIAKSVDPSTGSFSWEVPATLGNLATYGIKITLESDTDVYQFGFPFQIVGGSTSSSTGSATATATETETETSASSSATETDSSSASTSVAAPSSTIVSSTIRSNLSTTATGNPQTTITSLVTQQPTPTRSATTSLVTNGVASLAAGSFAMLGGVAMAVLAL